MTDDAPPPGPDGAPAHKRRARYRGKNPRHFAEKYKEHAPGRHADTIAKVLASGKTPAGMHVPIMVREILDALAPTAGERAVDCTLGYGGHAERLLAAVSPGGALLALDQDPIEIEKTESRLRAMTDDSSGTAREEVPLSVTLIVRRMNFAGLPRALAEIGWQDGADVILADLGVSSMQVDNPARGFSFKHDGPLDMRMNPRRGLPGAEFLRRCTATRLQEVLEENADEPRACLIAGAIAGGDFPTTRALAQAVRGLLPRSLAADEADATVRRVFQAVRIEVNEEFNALDTWLAALPSCLRPGGRVAVLTFHSGEDRRVKKALQAGERSGAYARVSGEVVRAGADELRRNPRASSAKLRWAVRA